MEGLVEIACELFLCIFEVNPKVGGIILLLLVIGIIIYNIAF